MTSIIIKWKAKENTTLKITLTKDSLGIIRNMGKVFFRITLNVGSTLVNSTKGKCKGKEFSNGKMEPNSLVVSKIMQEQSKASCRWSMEKSSLIQGSASLNLSFVVPLKY